MWLLTLLVLADSSQAFPLVLPRAESLQVAVAGAEAGAPVVLIPGLFGSAFAYRKVISISPPQRCCSPLFPCSPPAGSRDSPSRTWASGWGAATHFGSGFGLG